MVLLLLKEMASITEELSKYLTAPVQIFILVIVVFIVRKLMRSQDDTVPKDEEEEEELPPMLKRDFTLSEMGLYNGKDEKRILLGINGNVYDVTKGKRFYGPGGPYGLFAGRDASRCFATFSTDPSIVKDEYDDLSDLNSLQMESLSEWELQISEKYDHVGKLLKPDEVPKNYHMEESEDEVKSVTEKKVE